jgi:MFS family permease
MNDNAERLLDTAGTNAQQHRESLRRVGFASLIGTLIEYYDFVIFSAIGAVVFPASFFPALGSAAGTVATFATVGVAFVARPIGSVLFGHIGDRLGRKRTLASTLTLMGVATVLIGLTPTSEQIGLAAPIILVALRVCQGVAVGGEWAGATLMAAENAPKSKRGFWTMLASVGGVVGTVLGLVTFLVVSTLMSDHSFMTYGWRIPFVSSLLLLAVGLYVRLTVEETPVFTAELANRARSAAPLAEALKEQPRELVLGSGLLVMVFSLAFMVQSYLITYATSTLGHSRSLVVALTLLGSLAFGICIVISGRLSDRTGRRTIMVAANAVGAFWALALFPVIDLGTVWSYGIGVTVTMMIAGFAYGPSGAMLSELFHTRYRYTATAVTSNVSGVIGGSIPPVVAASVAQTYGGFAVGIFLAALCSLALLSSVMLREPLQDAPIDLP